MSILLMEETRVPGENCWPAASNWKRYHIKVVLSTPGHEQSRNMMFIIGIRTVHKQIYSWFDLIYLLMNWEGFESAGGIKFIASNWKRYHIKVVLSTPGHEQIQTHNFSGDSHWLHM
jgi:hypothetical protein